MRKNTSRLGMTILLSLLMVSWGLSIVTADTVTVYIYEIHEPVPWKGKTFNMNGGTYWAGEIHIQYGGTPPAGTYTRAYCLEYDVILHTNQLYEYTVFDVEDNDMWQAVSYILSWYDPPDDNNGAASVQGAIWEIVTGYDPSGYGSGLASEASGKDAIRESDTFEWLPHDGYIEPNGMITLTAVIKNSTGYGRPDVKVLFETSGGTLDKEEGFTDSEGEVSVTLTAPAEYGIVEVQAYTRGVWPQIYLCQDTTQNLIGLGDGLNLTTTIDIFVFTHIFVIPELQYGTLATIVTCFFGLLLKTKKYKIFSLIK